MKILIIALVLAGPAMVCAEVRSWASDGFGKELTQEEKDQLSDWVGNSPVLLRVRIVGRTPQNPKEGDKIILLGKIEEVYRGLPDRGKTTQVEYTWRTQSPPILTPSEKQHWVLAFEKCDTNSPEPLPCHATMNLANFGFPTSRKPLMKAFEKIIEELYGRR